MKPYSLSFHLFLLSVCLGRVSAQGGTEVGGRISSNTTWALSGSPYTVTSDIELYNAWSTPVTLTIEPGWK